MTTPYYLPACCTALNDHWPLPVAVPGVRLLSTRFDPSQLQADDFNRCAIEPIKAVAKRQAEYLAGRLCAREALRRVTGQGHVPASGADRAPQWPAGTCGSISHSTGWAGAVVGLSRQWQSLGLDIEQLIPAERAQRLAGEILTAAELERLQGLSESAQAQLITLTFSLKESLFKALYPLTLKRFYFHDAELLTVDAQQGQLRLLLDLSPEWQAGALLNGQFTEFEGYLLSLISIEQSAKK
ncbi:4'-phosphopantetheinyl transferase [Pseudomonas sp. 5P_3.1_Bac2]|uniref:4'-phosphopantetheinyl transferase family protein n=1 Tax=Pseudomonas sp. 5P_3.1_Bac2 TaxID=2971617 RepID=UPI0021C72830|nr:4'-phosphopantetheinyl transferase superfamily protein [Pseudomonas sp. 5P_3.1_Bac2]MCU1716841.1 4'-phosphopantetheinyl transferase superfamily protein [Pseudomonas sp. 5P_3.1_Bac2]